MKYSVKYKRVFDKDGNIVDISNVNEANRLPEYYSIGSNTPMIAALTVFIVILITKVLSKILRLFKVRLGLEEKH